MCKPADSERNSERIIRRRVLGIRRDNYNVDADVILIIMARHKLTLLRGMSLEGIHNKV